MSPSCIYVIFLFKIRNHRSHELKMYIDTLLFMLFSCIFMWNSKTSYYTVVYSNFSQEKMKITISSEIAHQISPNTPNQLTEITNRWKTMYFSLTLCSLFLFRSISHKKNVQVKTDACFKWILTYSRYSANIIAYLDYCRNERICQTPTFPLWSSNVW